VSAAGDERRAVTQVRGEKTIAGLRRLSAGIQDAARLILAAAVEATVSSAKATKAFTDRRSNDGTRSTIKGTVAGNFGRVRAEGAAVFLENGTKAHTITARNGGMLRFFVNGQALFRRSVRHPGTRARPFMAEAARHGDRVIEYAAEIYISEAIARA
jgi:hypothetical protein